MRHVQKYTVYTLRSNLTPQGKVMFSTNLQPKSW